MKRLAMTTLIAALYLTAPTAGNAEDGVIAHSPPTPLSGGLICDTLEQAIEAIQNPRTQVEGCGILRGVRVGTVALLPTFEHNGLIFQMARYDFMGDPGFNPVQYGFFGRPTPKSATPASLGTDA